MSEDTSQKARRIRRPFTIHACPMCNDAQWGCHMCNRPRTKEPEAPAEGADDGQDDEEEEAH